MLRVIIITMRMELVKNMDNNQSLGTNAKKIRLIRVATIIKKKRDGICIYEMWLVKIVELWWNCC